MNLFINISIIILTISIGTISVLAKTKKTIRRKSKLTKWGKLLIIATLGLVFLQIFQIYLNTEKEIQQEKALLKRDSLHKDFIQKNNQSILKPFAEGFAKYGQKYDTAKREIEKLVTDSIKKVIVSEPTINPEFSLCNFYLERNVDTLKITYEVCATQAAAYEINYNVYIISRFKENKLAIEENSNHTMPKLLKDNPMQRVSEAIITTSDFDKIYIYVKGTYKDFYNKPYKFDRIMSASTYKTAYLTIKEYNWVKNFLKQNGID